MLAETSEPIEQVQRLPLLSHASLALSDGKCLIGVHAVVAWCQWILKKSLSNLASALASTSRPWLTCDNFSFVSVVIKFSTFAPCQGAPKIADLIHANEPRERTIFDPCQGTPDTDILFHCNRKSIGGRAILVSSYCFRRGGGVLYYCSN